MFVLQVLTCYNAGIRLEDVEKEMLQFVPKVFEFVSEYVRKKPNTSSVNQHVSICLNIVQNLEQTVYRVRADGSHPFLAQVTGNDVPLCYLRLTSSR